MAESERARQQGKATLVNPKSRPNVSSATRVASSRLGSVEWAPMFVITVARRAIW